MASFIKYTIEPSGDGWAVFGWISENERKWLDWFRSRQALFDAFPTAVNERDSVR